MRTDAMTRTVRRLGPARTALAAVLDDRGDPNPSWPTYTPPPDDPAGPRSAATPTPDPGYQ